MSDLSTERKAYQTVAKDAALYEQEVASITSSGRITATPRGHIMLAAVTRDYVSVSDLIQADKLNAVGLESNVTVWRAVFAELCDLHSLGLVEIKSNGLVYRGPKLPKAGK